MKLLVTQRLDGRGVEARALIVERGEHRELTHHGLACTGGSADEHSPALGDGLGCIQLECIESERVLSSEALHLRRILLERSCGGAARRAFYGILVIHHKRAYRRHKMSDGGRLESSEFDAGATAHHRNNQARWSSPDCWGSGCSADPGQCDGRRRLPASAELRCCSAGQAWRSRAHRTGC